MKIYLAGGFHSGWQDVIKQKVPLELNLKKALELVGVNYN